MICFNWGGGFKPDQINEIWDTIVTQSLLILVLLIGSIALIVKKFINKWKEKQEFKIPYIIACSEIVEQQYAILLMVLTFSNEGVGERVKKILQKFEKKRIWKWKSAKIFNEILRLIADGQVTTVPDIKKRAAELVARYDEIAKLLNNIK